MSAQTKDTAWRLGVVAAQLKPDSAWISCLQFAWHAKKTHLSCMDFMRTAVPLIIQQLFQKRRVATGFNCL